jgi:hypothetical protein
MDVSAASGSGTVSALVGIRPPTSMRISHLIGYDDAECIVSVAEAAVYVWRGRLGRAYFGITAASERRLARVLARRMVRVVYHTFRGDICHGWYVLPYSVRWS